ncbi:MFS transporter [Pseudomonas moraviensis subsp. stanleyae]|uniref:MFS transporter n=1 Tax=Pseudomonas moraviensis TaxID=321662 RepID=UPI002E37EEA5|nr:MFS transporter [Pseudomonas moraviensis]MED7666749.1 MFS transporter [Pseudomonas moraviensis subsp. stanleyae]
MIKAEKFAPPVWSHEIRQLLWMQGLMNASHFMTVPLLALYMSANLHFGAAALASVMSANLLCAQALPLAAGAIADRFGSQMIITLGLMLRGIGFLGFGLCDGVIAWICSAMIAGTGVACYEGGVYGVFGRQPKTCLSALFAANNQMLNTGAALGPLVGGVAGLIDIRAAFAASAILFLSLSVVAFRAKFGSSILFKKQRALRSLKIAATHRGLWRLIFISLPWFFLFPQLYVAFPMYASQIAGPHAASAVYVLNGVVGLTFIVAMKRWLVSVDPAPLTTWAYLAAGVAFASVAMLCGIEWFLLFIVAYTVIETILLPTLETMTASLATDGSQGTFFGVLSAVGALGGAAGYYVGSWLILNRTPVETWLTLGSVGLLGFLVSVLLLPMPKEKPSPS